MNYETIRPRLTGNRKKAFEHLNTKEKRILVVGDIHAPFNHQGYLDFCIDVYAKWNLNQVIFIGDIIDNHFSSFHTTDPDGLGGSDELDLAMKKALALKDKLVFLDVLVDPEEHVYPMHVAPDGSMRDMWLSKGVRT